MSYSPTETIFDFHVTDIPQERIQAWQEQAEHLLDEGSAGAASSHAADNDLLREQWTERNKRNLAEHASGERSGISGADVPAINSSALKANEPPPQAETSGPVKGGGGMGLLYSEISGLLEVEPDQIQVFPNPELPSITSRNELAHTEPMLASPESALSNSTPTGAHSRFVDSSRPSRLLRVPSEPLPDPTAKSLLMRPAPALGKVPPPTAPPVSLTAEQIHFLDEEIAYLYSEVNRVLATRREITGHALSLLREAREIVLTESHRLGRAEHNLNQVRSILERAQESRRQSSRRGFRVLLYLALWLATTAAAGITLFLYGADLTQVATTLLGSESRVMAHLHPILWVMVTGSAGAVVGAILGFLAHVRSDQDFDRQHLVRFSIQPVMGIVLGITLYLLFSLFFASMQIDLTARSLTRALPVVLALPAGLWQEWIYASLYRMFGFFTLRPRRR